MKPKLLPFFLCMMLMVSCGDGTQPTDVPPSVGTEQPGDKEGPGNKENPEDPGTGNQPGDTEKPVEPGTPDDPDTPNDPVNPTLPDWDPDVKIPEGNIHTFYVASRLFDSGDGVAYFVIKYEGAELWHYVDYMFGNFTYEEGYEYLVKAELKPLDPPVMGADKLYDVSEIISKEKKDSENLPF